jgi:hypothetical protein
MAADTADVTSIPEVPDPELAARMLLMLYVDVDAVVDETSASVVALVLIFLPASVRAPVSMFQSIT